MERHDITDAVPEGDYAKIADVIEQLPGDAMRVGYGGHFTLTFETARERLHWSDGFREGARFASQDVLLVDWLEAWLREQAQTDPMEKEGAARRVAVCAEKMSPKTRDRGAKLAKALESWRAS